MSLFVQMIKPVLTLAARRTLLGRYRSPGSPEQGRFTGREVRAIMARTWRQAEQLMADLPTMPNLGGRLMVRLAALTLAHYRALRRQGLEKAHAMELVCDTCWRVYRLGGLLPLLLTRFTTSDPQRRMNAKLRLFLRFPFNRPGYCYDTPSLPGTFALYIRHCPVADYLASQGAADLCFNTWCTLDYPLAELWGGRFQRSKNLAAGDDVCDMHWTAD